MGVTAIFELLLKLKRTFLTKKFIIFSLVGVINTVNDAIFSSIFHRLGLQDNVAAVVGYLVALTIAFFLNCRFIFNSSPSFSKYIKFCISYVPNFIIYFLVTFITINTMGVPQFWGTILAAVVGGPVTFVIMKVFTFSNK